MSLDTLKSLKIAYIFIVTGIVYFAFIPAFSKRCRKSGLTLGLMNAFAGGVFLAMALIHILPEAAEEYTEAMTEESSHAGHSSHRLLDETDEESKENDEDEEEKHSRLFPLPYLMFFLGYAVVLVVDRVISAHFGSAHSHGAEEEVEHHRHHDLQESDHSLEKQKVIQIQKNDDQSNGVDLKHKKQQSNQDGQNENEKKTKQNQEIKPQSDKDLENQNQNNDSPHSPDHHTENAFLDQLGSNHKQLSKIEGDQQVIVQEQSEQSFRSYVKNEEVQAKKEKKQIQETFHHHNHEHHHHGSEKRVEVCGFNIAPLVLLIALGFHSVFEGIALGLIEDLNAFINLMIGVTIHHIVACVSYGVSLGQSETKSKKVIVLSIVGLSFFESGGLAIGLGLSGAPTLVGSIILSFAGGTFIYIACSEILVHEFSDPKYRYPKFAMFIFGAAIITCLWFLDAGH